MVVTVILYVYRGPGPVVPTGGGIQEYEWVNIFTYYRIPHNTEKLWCYFG